MPISAPGPFRRSLDAFITKNQRKSLTEGSAALDQANDEALQAALHASLTHSDEGLTAAQIFARETGDPETIRQANDEALALGLQASLEASAHPAKSSKTAKAPRTAVPHDELSIQRRLIDKLKQALKHLGYDIQPNQGTQNNCLIISMLQHASGDYHSEHTAQARHYKKLLAERSGGTEKTSNALFSDNDLTCWLIDKINHDTFGDKRENYIKFKFVTADLDGNPAVRTLGDGSRVAGIVDLAGHYEAYIPRTED